jgi:hypothetical protein
MGVEVGIGMSAVGGITSAIGSIMGGKAKKRAAEAQARQLEAQAQEVLRRSELNRIKMKEEQKQFEGVQASGFAKGGIDLGTGSPLLVMAETAIQFEKDIAEEKRQAEFEAAQIRAGAAAQRQSGRDSARAGRIGAIGDIVGAGANIYSQTRSPKGTT